MSGAVTALGDTVYPVQGQGSLQHLARDQAAGAHFLGKLRVVHPLLALLGVAGLWVAASRARDVTGFPAIERLGGLLYLGGGLALGVGLLNIWLGAPGYVQVAHCLLWLSTVVLAACCGTPRAARRTEGIRASDERHQPRQRRNHPDHPETAPRSCRRRYSARAPPSASGPCAPRANARPYCSASASWSKRARKS